MDKVTEEVSLFIGTILNPIRTQLATSCSARYKTNFLIQPAAVRLHECEGQTERHGMMRYVFLHKFRGL